MTIHRDRASRSESDSDDLVSFVRSGAHKVGQSIEVPSPVGRNMAGWVNVQFKIQPEAIVMLDQLREHKFFRGKWKTQSHVAWSMMYLGLQALHKFVDEDWDGWEKYKSNYYAAMAAASEWSKVQRQQKLCEAGRLYRMSIHSWLDKDTAYGRYAAFKALTSALETRDVVEDVKEYDGVMLTADRGVTLGTSLVFDNRAGDLYKRCVPEPGRDIVTAEYHALQVEMTQPYLDELEAENAKPEDEFDF